MSLRKYAQFLGRRGGVSRAKRLAPGRLRQIASSGGTARAASLAAARRIADNYVYLDAMEVLRGGPIAIESVAVCEQPLPRARRGQARR